MKKLVRIIIAIGVAIPLFVLIKMMLNPVDFSVSDMLETAIKNSEQPNIKPKGYNIVIDSSLNVFVNDVKTDINKLSSYIDSIDRQGEGDTILSLDVANNVEMTYLIKIMNIAKEKKKKFIIKSSKEE